MCPYTTTRLHDDIKFRHEFTLLIMAMVDGENDGELEWIWSRRETSNVLDC